MTNFIVDDFRRDDDIANGISFGRAIFMDVGEINFRQKRPPNKMLTAKIEFSRSINCKTHKFLLLCGLLAPSH